MTFYTVKNERKKQIRKFPDLAAGGTFKTNFVVDLDEIYTAVASRGFFRMEVPYGNYKKVDLRSVR